MSQFARHLMPADSTESAIMRAITETASTTIDGVTAIDPDEAVAALAYVLASFMATMPESAASVYLVSIVAGVTSVAREIRAGKQEQMQ